MSVVIIFLLLFLFLSFTSIFLYLKLQDERNNPIYLQGNLNPYKKKKYFLTLEENNILFLVIYTESLINGQAKRIIEEKKRNI